MTARDPEEMAVVPEAMTIFTGEPLVRTLSCFLTRDLISFNSATVNMSVPPIMNLSDDLAFVKKLTTSCCL